LITTRTNARLSPSLGPLLELVPKKLLDFLDQNMLQFFGSERFLFDQMIPFDREAL
jgi:hypothetical protein